MCNYPGADCHQSSAIATPWPMCVTIQGQTATSHQPFHPGLCVTIQRQTATSHQPFHPGLCVPLTATSQPFHPGLCVPLSRGRLPPVNHSTLAYVCHYPRLPPVNHSTLAYVCHYPGADCHQSSTIPPWLAYVSLSRARLSRLRLTQQSLKRVGHEGKLCLKGEQRHPPCLVRSHCLSQPRGKQ